MRMHITTFVLLLCFLQTTKPQTTEPDKKCENLLIGQYKCLPPEIDLETQAEKGCRPNKTVLIKCHAAPEIVCQGVKFPDNKTGFYRQQSCRYVNGKSFTTAMLLSIFLGVFGVDRFYLGYPAIALFKFCTLGFFMIFQFIDVILLATQVVKPADGSDFYMDYFGYRSVVPPNQTLYEF